MSKKRNKRNIRKNRKSLKTRFKNPVSIISVKTFLKQEEYIKKLQEVIVQREFFNDNNKLFEGNDVKFIPSYKSLPKDIVEKITNHVKKHPIRKQFCYNNGTQIGLSIPGVQIVHGFYKGNLNHLLEEQPTPNSRNLVERIIKDVKNLKEEWIRYKWDKDSTEYYYLNTKTLDYWMRHVWNKYDGVHFDLSVEFFREDKLDMFNKWKYYKEVKTLKPSEIVDSNELKKVKISFNKLISFISGSIPSIG